MPYLSKQQLACMYHPDVSQRTAINAFRRSLSETPGLMAALEAANYKRTQKLLSPLQVSIIFSFIGEP